MSEVTLEERGRALENQFYDKQNQDKIAAMKSKLDSQSSKEDLRKVSGMTDDTVLEKLVHLGLAANTIAALSLVPLIQVAWADGAIQDNELIVLKGLAPGVEVAVSNIQKIHDGAPIQPEEPDAGGPSSSAR